MSSTEQLDAEETSEEGEQSRQELLTELEILAEENQQLRASYTRAKQTQYQRTAIGLGLIGAVAVIGAVVVPTSSEILFALGGIGLFSALLTYYLTPEQFVSADVGRDVYQTLAGNEAALSQELALSETRVYIPTSSDTVRLFVPQHETAPLPDRERLSQTVVISDEESTRGLALDPSGSPLFDAVEDTVSGGVGTAPSTLAEQLTDAVVEQFELARGASPELDAEGGQLTVAISGSVYGPLDRFDHPIPSLLAVGLAHGLDEPISVSITESGDGRAEYVVTCRWETESDA